MSHFEKIGTVKSVCSKDVGCSRFGLGFEKLDRAVFDPEKAYDKVAELGVKWVRIQSGWARTEKEKGYYDFQWIDSIVDNLINRGLIPWICLCYGNELYDENAAKVFGAVGCPPIHNSEQKKAWNNYVKTIVKRYRGKVTYYEVWNEADGEWCWKHGVNGKEYGSFVIDTAKAIREGNPDAKVVGGAVCGVDFDWLSDVFQTGAGKYMDAFSYHGYASDECHSADPQRFQALKALCRRQNPKMEMIQGETGTQSRDDGAGALRGGAWTPEKQSKFLLRHMMSHLFLDTKFTSYFSCMDMIEALNGTVGDKSSYLDYGYFGLLGAEFDSDGFATGEYKQKLAYRSYQVLASIFREEFWLEDLPLRFIDGVFSRRLLRNDDINRKIIARSFKKPNGSSALVYWMPSELLTTSYESTLSLECAGIYEKIHLIDLKNGDVFDVPDDLIIRKENGYLQLLHLPLKDYPMLLTFGDFSEYELKTIKTKNT